MKQTKVFTRQDEIAFCHILVAVDKYLNNDSNATETMVATTNIKTHIWQAINYVDTIYNEEHANSTDSELLELANICLCISTAFDIIGSDGSKIKYAKLACDIAPKSEKGKYLGLYNSYLETNVETN